MARLATMMAMLSLKLLMPRSRPLALKMLPWMSLPLLLLLPLPMLLSMLLLNMLWI